jgi:hypothetical protein
LFCMIEESLPVIPADRYNNCHDICVITCYFNPEGYKTKLVNYTIFSQKLALSGIALYTIELAFENQPFVLPNTPCSLQIRGEDVIWQKERLINILFQKIPPRFSKIIWLDCDLLFQNENWLVEASAALDDHKVIQPFQWVVRLPRYEQYYSKYGEKHESFCSVWEKDHSRADKGVFDQHGHTGFAWGIRRELLARHGLYDTCISGSADHLMAHAFCGNMDCICVHRMIGDGKYFQHFSKWGSAIANEVNGDLGYVDGYLLHLWHGQTIDRKYHERNQELIKMNFDPEIDLITNGNGLLQLSSKDSKFKNWSIDLFSRRKEDGIDA